MALKRVTKPRTFKDWQTLEWLAYLAGWAFVLLYTLSRVGDLVRPGDSAAYTIGFFLGLLAVRVLPAWLVMWLVQGRERGKPGQERACKPAYWWIWSHVFNGLILIPIVFLFTDKPTLVNTIPEEDIAPLEVQEA